MRQFTIKDQLFSIKYHKKEFEKFVVQANLILKNLHSTFNQPEIGINTSTIIDNSFQFTFFGLLYNVKTEILFDSERKNFILGELNTYIKVSDVEELLLSFNFDSIGNIGNGLVLEDFSLVYFADLFPKAIKYSQDKNVKFQLK